MRRPSLLVTTAVSSMLVLSGCGGASASSVAARPAAARAAASRAPASVVAETSGGATITRAQLEAVLDGGLGRFLGRVETEPAREAGQFVGFRIVALEGSLASDDPASSGLRAGDIVLRVNGQIIERPEQAFAVWEGLRVASTLAIEYLRAGQRREARFEIVD